MQINHSDTRIGKFDLIFVITIGAFFSFDSHGNKLVPACLLEQVLQKLNEDSLRPLLVNEHASFVLLVEHEAQVQLLHLELRLEFFNHWLDDLIYEVKTVNLEFKLVFLKQLKIQIALDLIQDEVHRVRHEF
jgi:hypothetical protein